MKGGFLLTGALACFLYNSASLVLGAAYNNLFLLYLVYFSASLYAFVLAFTSIDLQALPGHVSPRLPHRGTAVFMFLAGLSPCVWLIDIVSALLQGQVPQGLASYTTSVTTVLDVGIITPAAFLAGVLLLRRKPLGYLLASTLLILLTLIGLVVVGQTVMQALDGVVLSTGEIATYVAPFVLLSLIAIWLTARILRIQIQHHTHVPLAQQCVPRHARDVCHVSLQGLDQHLLLADQFIHNQRCASFAPFYHQQQTLVGNVANRVPYQSLNRHQFLS